MHTLTGLFSNCPIRSFRMTSDMLLKQNFSLEQIRLGPDFVDRLIRLLAFDPASDDIIGEYLLAFDVCHFPFIAYTTAKQLLKTRPSCLLLYNAYGLAESYRGNSVKAGQVLSMALSIRQEGSVLSAPEGLKLFQSWVWESLHRSEPKEALWRLVSTDGQISRRLTQEQDTSPNEDLLVRAGAVFSKRCEEALLRQDYEAAILSTSLLALLAYLSSGCKVELAIDVHRNLSAWFSSHALSDSASAELHAQTLVALLTYHVAHAPIVQPALVRRTLEPLLAQFPNNTLLLSVYAANEARFAIDDRVRDIMHNRALRGLSETSSIGWSFAIHYESLRNTHAGSTSHSIRSLYKRATGSTGAHCPALWRSYLQFEVAQLHKEMAVEVSKKPHKEQMERTRRSKVEDAKERVRETIYAALRNIPWCKDVTMVAFTEASDALDKRTRWELCKIMQEKELRFYVEPHEAEVHL